MVGYNELVLDILTESNNCPEMILERNLRNTSISFLQDSELWQERIVIPTVEDQGEYPLTQSDDRTIVKLTLCSVGGRELLQAVPQRRFDGKGSPDYYFLRDNAVHLRPFDRLKGDITLEVVYKPNRNSVGIPQIIADEWFETLQQGALARTLAMAGTPWYNPQRAMMYAQQYDLGLQEAIRVGKRMNHSRISVTRFHW
jgi:hypothetical protein